MHGGRRYRWRAVRTPARRPTAYLLALLAALAGLGWWTQLDEPGDPAVALLIFVGLCELAALSGMLLVRRSVQLGSLEAHKEHAGFVYATLGAAYAVLLSFMVVVSWNRFQEAQQTTSKEALTLATLFHLAAGFDNATRTEIQTTLLAYTQTVIAEEWPAMDRGMVSDHAWSLSDQLWDDYLHASPTAQGTAEYQHSLSQMETFYALRGARTLQSTSSLPSTIQIVLVGGASITVGFTYLFGVRNALAHAVMTAALTAIIAGSLYLIFDLDTPYSGPLHVDPVPFETSAAFFRSQLQQ